jgi:bifunctional N-acetylglucosamine-1-phosphate-uridyltransferase/glucosamine-1-phosphate-acetyltransferase GlmU-like protein
MTHDAPTLKVVILAAGRNLLPKMSRRWFGAACEHKVIDYVVQNALQLASPEDLYVIVAGEDDAVTAHLRAQGVAAHFVVQQERRGTGHAVLQLAPLLADFDGDLLILYGDTPLFRPASIRGLLNRHRLKQAQLTLLIAVMDHPLPYGRIIRDARRPDYGYHRTY